MVIEEQRQQRRIERRLCIHFRPVDLFPAKWDMSMTQNISMGGIKFTASSNLWPNNGIIEIKIRIPELSLRCLELKAIVQSTQSRFNGRTTEIRAKFIDTSEEDKKCLCALGNP